MTEKINIDRNKHETLTSYIKHLADSVNFKGVTSNKLCSGLTEKCFNKPNVSYK